MRCALVTGVQTCALPIWLAIALMVFSAVIVGFLQPYTRYAYRALVYTVTHTAWDTALERGTFFTGFGNKTIVVDGISQGGRQLSGLFIHERSEEHTSELQSLMRISYAVFCLKKQTTHNNENHTS